MSVVAIIIGAQVQVTHTYDIPIWRGSLPVESINGVYMHGNIGADLLIGAGGTLTSLAFTDPATIPTIVSLGTGAFLAKNPTVYVNTESELAAAIAAGSKNITSMGTYALTANRTLAAGQHLEVLSGVITTTGFTLNTSAGTFNAPQRQVFAGTGAVVFPPSIKEINPVLWGFAPGATAAVNTAALQAAVNASTASYVSYSTNAIMTGQNLVGNAPWIVIPGGKYEINDTITYSYYSRFKSNGGIIYQSDNTKDIFYSEHPFRNEFRGINFVGGKSHIVVQNGPTGQVGLEGVQVIVDGTDHQVSASYAIKFAKSGAGGGEQGIIRGSKFNHCSQMLYAYFDATSLSDVWGEPENTLSTDDTAMIVSNNLSISNFAGVPTGNWSATTNRWIDNYGVVHIKDSRFGSEGTGGMPIVYNFTNAIGASASQPYMKQYQISIRDSMIAHGHSGKPDSGVIVLKAGLPHTIILEGNYYAAYSQFIRTDAMSEGVTLTDYMATISTYDPVISIRILDNIQYGIAIASSEGDIELLNMFMEYTMMWSGGALPGTSTSKGGNTICIRGVKTFKYAVAALADDGTVSLPNASSGIVKVSCNAEGGEWKVNTDGSVVKLSGTTNTDAADTDAKLDVYDGGTYAIVKNRLGATGNCSIVYEYK